MRSLRVLIVDDSATALQHFEEALLKLGHQPAGAKNAESALDRISQERFDLILSDLVMPDTDGISLLREVRRRGLDLPFIIVTSYGSLSSAVAAVREGADDYITKPISEELLAHRLGSVVARQMAAEQKVQHRQLEAALATAGAAAHELNQPLMSIMATAELIKDTQDPDQVRELAEIIVDQTDRLGRITHDLIGLVRYRTKPYVGQTSILDLAASAREHEE